MDWKETVGGKIVVGMSLHEAIILGGDYFFKVKADASVWPKNSDPNLIIAEQAIRPDGSEIWLVFENGVQFASKGVTRFSVRFKCGIVVGVDEL